MEYKVHQFINSNAFQKNTFPEIDCYLESFNLKKGHFNKKEQIELFDYFFNLRKRNILPYFTNYLRFKLDIIIESEIFYEIKSYIVEKLDEEIKLILEKSEVLENDIFNLFDYIVSICKETNKDIIIDYIKKSFDKIRIFINESPNIMENENNKIYKSITMLNIIDYLNIDTIKEELNYIISHIDIDKNKVDFSFTVFQLLLREEILDIDKKDFIYFIISSNNIENRDFMYLTDISLYYNMLNKIVDKINNINFLADIFNDYFPAEKSIYIVTYRELLVQFIISKKCIDINNGSIDNIFSEEYKNYLLIYIGYIYNSYRYKNQQDLIINIDDYSKLEIDLTYLLKEVKKYIAKLSTTDDFPRREDYIWSKRLFKEYVNSIEIYSTCSESAKQFRIELINSENDPIFRIKDNNKELLKKIKYNLSNEIKAKKKKEEIDKKQEEEKINCINKFFSLDDIKNDFRKIIEQFSETILKKINFSITINDINDPYMYSNIEEYLNKTIDILNPFLISYIRDISFYFYKDKINLEEIFDNVINNWNEYYILHLYNYLISIKKYDYNFSDKKKEEIINYFHNKKIKFPKYVLMHAEKVFGFDLKLKDLFDDDTVIEILNTDYIFIQFDMPEKVLVYKNIYLYPKMGVINTNLNFEKRDFSIFFNTYGINIENIFNKCLSIIDIKKSILFAIDNYYLFLSIINLYDILDNKKAYEEKFFQLLKDYFYESIISDKKLYSISDLIVQTAENFNLVEDILNIILENSDIKVVHYNIFSKWQDNILYDNLYKKEYLEIIYEIRQKIRKSEINIKTYNFNIKNNINDFREKINTITKTDNICGIANELYNELKPILDKCNRDILYYKYDNIVNLLYFIYKDISIFEDFLKMNTNNYGFQEKSINNLFTLFKYNDISNELMLKISHTIYKYYDDLKYKECPVNMVYTPEFDLKYIFDRIIDMIINTNKVYQENIYDKLINIGNISEYTKNRLENKKKSIFSPMKISKSNDKFIITRIKERLLDKSQCEIIEYDDKEYDSISDIKTDILNSINLKDGLISRIVGFTNLVDDIKNKHITMSHPYLFDDDIENVYPINNNLYISCFSYSTGNENAYAWWKLYGGKNKFRITVDIESFINSIISIFEEDNTIDIYIGSLDYKKDAPNVIIDEWGFFNKRIDFQFENELRVMVKVNNIDDNRIKLVNGLPVLYKFTMKDTSIYKNMSLEYRSVIFHPYEKTLLDKDKEAMRIELQKYIDNL
ncbi:hypothetical protein [Brachyspira pilosicoli]|uniref:hypothetical protein n=1 Tax=Brachyspira pilosicoli TaxID=52584 RepID=UPI0012F68FA5|nr:hypothetical protein [Brachyspira pilosicoli]